jgi:hypothetical protein
MNSLSAFGRLVTLLVLISSSVLALPSLAQPSKIDLDGPPGSVAFGANVAVLPNGNLVVTDPRRPPNGAAYLFSPDLDLISTVSNVAPGAGEGTPLDAVQIIVLTNGNYLLANKNWHNGTGFRLGMVAWASGDQGLSGAISADNALVGSTNGDRVGVFDIKPLPNGNYVVATFSWSNGLEPVGAVTWGSGTSGVSGPITANNSIIGSPSLRVSLGAVLSNGNFVVSSWGVATGRPSNSAAFRWVDGSVGGEGLMTVENSLTGSSEGDFYAGQVFPLSNGSYVISVPYWDNGPLVDAGAAVWADGTRPTVGQISAANALVGGRSGNFVGLNGVASLANGNYVVVSPDWEGSVGINRGAVTWGSGSSGVTGEISAVNSLVGSADFDFVGGDPIYVVDGAAPLTNGHYVVSSPRWGAERGAVTWGDGTRGVVGEISPSNSLVGSTPGDSVGRYFRSAVTALANGNYVVNTPAWHRPSGERVGAVTWVSGYGVHSGEISLDNSVIGAENDGPPHATPLANGNYVVSFTQWDRGSVLDVGAVVWGDGDTGTAGTVSEANAMVGARENDRIGSWPVALSDGNYVLCSPNFSTAQTSNAGAATWLEGKRPTIGEVGPHNSLIGSSRDDQLCSGQADYIGLNLPDGRFLLSSPFFDDGAVPDAFAITYADGPLAGSINETNSVIGSWPNGGEEGGQPGLIATYDHKGARLVVGRPASSKVTIMTTARILRSGFEESTP